MHVKKIKKNLKTIYKLQNSNRKIRKEKKITQSNRRKKNKSKKSRIKVQKRK